MKRVSAVVLILGLCGIGSAQVAPGQAALYTGILKANTITTNSSLDDHSKNKVICTIADDGSTVISSHEGLLITGHLDSGARFGFLSFGDGEFTTGTGLLRFNNKGNIKGDLLYGVQPGGDVVYSVKAQLNLKKVKDKTTDPRPR
jgi:hypothetical protein